MRRISCAGVIGGSYLSVVGSASGLAWFGWFWATGTANAVDIVYRVAC